MLDLWHAEELLSAIGGKFNDDRITNEREASEMEHVVLWFILSGLQEFRQVLVGPVLVRQAPGARTGPSGPWIGAGSC